MQENDDCFNNECPYVYDVMVNTHTTIGANINVTLTIEEVIQ